MLIVRTPVRVSFGGGGTDLPAYYERFGGAVLSAAIDRYFYTVVNRRNDRRIQVISSDLHMSKTWHSVDEMRAAESSACFDIPLVVLKCANCQDGIDVFLASEVPPGSGLGSSASMCVGLLQAVSMQSGIPLSKYDLAAQAFHLTANVLGKPVGKQDEVAAAYGGLNFILFRHDGSTCVKRVKVEREVLSALQRKLMLFFTGVTRDSSAILEEQHASSTNGESSTLEALHHIHKLAYRMRDILESGDLQSFGRLLHEGWAWKKSVCSKISNAGIDRLYELALSKGATGGKITGAGGGGFLLLYCDEQYQPAVRAAFEGECIRELRFAFDFEGSRAVNAAAPDPNPIFLTSWDVTTARKAFGGSGSPLS